MTINGAVRLQHSLLIKRHHFHFSRKDSIVKQLLFHLFSTFLLRLFCLILLPLFSFTHAHVHPHSRFEFLLTQHQWNHIPAGRSRTERFVPITKRPAPPTPSTDLSWTVFQHPRWMWCHQLLHHTQACRVSMNSTGLEVHVHYAKHVLTLHQCRCRV